MLLQSNLDGSKTFEIRTIELVNFLCERFGIDPEEFRAEHELRYAYELSNLSSRRVYGIKLKYVRKEGTSETERVRAGHDQPSTSSRRLGQS